MKHTVNVKFKPAITLHKQNETTNSFFNGYFSAHLRFYRNFLRFYLFFRVYSLLRFLYEATVKGGRCIKVIFCLHETWVRTCPVNMYLFKVNNRNSRAKYKISRNFPGISGNLVVISKPPPQSGFSLWGRAKKRGINFFKKFFVQS